MGDVEYDADDVSFGWTAQFDHTFPQKRKQGTIPTWKQFWSMFILGCRYVCYYIYLMFKRRLPVMDFIVLAQNKVSRGVPIGGIGCGSIGRRFNGGFCNLQMVPGIYDDCIVPANQFIVTVLDDNGTCVYQKVLSSSYAPSCLTSWDWNFPAGDATYTGLYPRSWTTYFIRELNIKLLCRQVSPVIPNNYKDSSLPSAIFVWDIINQSDTSYHVSITFTFQNGTGTKRDFQGTVSGEFCEQSDGHSISFLGVSLSHSLNDMPYTYTMTALSNNSKVTRTFFDPRGSGKEIWLPLSKQNVLPDSPVRYLVQSKSLGCGVCSAVKSLQHSKNEVVFNLVWDMPKVTFPEKPIVFKRRYTKYFGDNGKASLSIAQYSYQNYSRWVKEIRLWQKPVIVNDSIPQWFKSALFNELYYISDGGTLWILPLDDEKFSDSDPRKEFGHFMYLEGHEYRMYNTYDVHFYASFALGMLWPKLQMSLQYDISDTIEEVDNNKIWYLYNGVYTERKKKGCVPHDIGDPCEEPLLSINSYPIHDVSEWKDLNLKFVLQVYRDYHLMQDISTLKDLFPNVLVVMERGLKWDVDGDGMIENSGFPDQTYDAWIMTGTSAYCGSLWLASLWVTVEIATILGDDSSRSKYQLILDKAKLSFDQKLWNGRYYNFDCSVDNRLSIMSDQLCGLWYLQCCGKGQDLLPQSQIKSALETIFQNNVMGYYGGKQGAVNGMLTDGKIDRASVQSEEMWIGVAYGLSALFMAEGMTKEAWMTSRGIYDTVYNQASLGFATPEALHSLDAFRSLAYMRPLSIWSIKMVLDRLSENISESQPQDSTNHC